MSEPTNPGTELIQVSAQLDLDDIVAVRLSDIEATLMENDRAITTQLKGANANLGAAKKDLRTMVDELAKSLYGKAAENLMPAFAALGATSTKTGITSRLMRETRSSTVEDVIQVSIIVSSSSGCQYKGGISFDNSVTPPQDVIDKRQEVWDIEDNINTLQGKIAEIRRALSKVGSYERQIRGQIARTRLGQTEEGRSVLEGVDNFRVRGLPELPATINQTTIGDYIDAAVVTNPE